MTNKDFISELAQRTGYTSDDTQKMVNAIVEKMGDHFQEDDAVLIPTFGVSLVSLRCGRSWNVSW